MKNEEKKVGRLNTFVLSLIFAIAIWVVVGIVDDPDIRNTVTSLPVRYTGTAELEERGLVIIAPEEKTTAAVVVSGKRGDLIRYGKNLYILVDVSSIDSPGEYTLKGSTQLGDDRISILRERIGEIEVIAEKRSEKEVPVEIKQTGTLKNSIIKAQPQHPKIKIKGAESEVNSVKAAVVTTDISEITQNISAYMDFVLVDEAGEELTKAQTLSATVDKIAVDYTMYEKKSLPIEPKLSAEFDSKYCIDKGRTTISPSSVEVGVLPECSAECVYADINNTDDEAKDFALIEEEGMYIPRENSKVRIKAYLIPSISRHMDLSVRIENLADGLNAEYSDTMTGVLVSAPEEVLNSGDFRLVADLKELDKGTHKVKAQISDDRVKIAEEIYIDVTIN